jgi:hypothetical protein
MEDIPLPDVLSFSPLKLTPEELDALIVSQYAELKSLHDDEREYKVDLAMTLYNAVNQRKMRNWSRSFEAKFCTAVTPG